MITGSLVAIVTPMHEDGRLDLARFRQLIDWHVAEGTDGIVVDAFETENIGIAREVDRYAEALAKL